MKYRKKPIVVEAFQLDDRGLIEEDWFWDAVSDNKVITHNFGKYHVYPAWCEIETLEGVMIAKAGDYIIKGTQGELYPCKADIFEKTYEKEEINNNIYRNKLVQKIKDVGQELIDRAEDMVGNDLNGVCDFDIFINLCQESDYNELPTFEWTTRVVNKNAVNRIKKVYEERV